MLPNPESHGKNGYFTHNDNRCWETMSLTEEESPLAQLGVLLTKCFCFLIVSKRRANLWGEPPSPPGANGL